jgi:hypothetical protein
MCGKVAYVVRAATIVLVSGKQNKEIDGRDFSITILEKSIVSIVGVDGLKNEAPGFS